MTNIDIQLLKDISNSDRSLVTCDRLVVFSEYSNFLHQQNWPPRYNWNIVESGVKHYNHQLVTKQRHCEFFPVDFSFMSEIFLTI